MGAHFQASASREDLVHLGDDWGDEEGHWKLPSVWRRALKTQSSADAVHSPANKRNDCRILQARVITKLGIPPRSMLIVVVYSITFHISEVSASG